MIVGIVGSEAAKFTRLGEQESRRRIRRLLKKEGVTEVVSGACHLGGIDIWAVEEARKLGIEVTEYPPEKHSWEFYRKRNIQIAKRAHKVLCFTVRTLPKNFRRRGWEGFCYHCQTTKHIKSGGCWTTKYARRLGKIGVTLVVDNYKKD
jgi:hypothetical protein